MPNTTRTSQVFETLSERDQRDYLTLQEVGAQDWYKISCRCPACIIVRGLTSGRTIEGIAVYLAGLGSESRTETVRWLINQMIRHQSNGVASNISQLQQLAPSCVICEATSENDDTRHVFEYSFRLSHNGRAVYCCDACWRNGAIFHCRGCGVVGQAGTSREASSNDTVDRFGREWLRFTGLSGGRGGWCQECANDRAEECYFCHEPCIDAGTAIDDYGHEVAVCISCIDNGDVVSLCSRCDYYAGCSACTYTDDGEVYCTACHDEVAEYCEGCDSYNIGECDCSQMSSWNYRPSSFVHHYIPMLESKRRVLYGVECELEYKPSSSNGRRHKGEDIKQILLKSRQYWKENGMDSPAGNLFYAKHDGSLADGCEFVSHPFTLLWAKRHIGYFEYFFDLLKEHNFEAEDRSSCGMHVHIDKSAFSGLDLYKILKLMHGNPFFTEKISKRKGDNGYGSLYKENHRNLLLKSRDKSGGGRHVAVNLGNRKTIEVRLFQGVDTVDSFFRNLEYCDAVRVFAKQTGLRGTSPMDFLVFLKKNAKMFPRILPLVERYVHI